MHAWRWKMRQSRQESIGGSIGICLHARSQLDALVKLVKLKQACPVFERVNRAKLDELAFQALCYTSYGCPHNTRILRAESFDANWQAVYPLQYLTCGRKTRQTPTRAAPWKMTQRLCSEAIMPVNHASQSCIMPVDRASCHLLLPVKGGNSLHNPGKHT
jgi:hypothetical protein